MTIHTTIATTARIELECPQCGEALVDGTVSLGIVADSKFILAHIQQRLDAHQKVEHPSAENHWCSERPFCTGHKECRYAKCYCGAPNEGCVCP